MSAHGLGRDCLDLTTWKISASTVGYLSRIVVQFVATSFSSDYVVLRGYAARPWSSSTLFLSHSFMTRCR